MFTRDQASALLSAIELHKSGDVIGAAACLSGVAQADNVVGDAERLVGAVPVSVADYGRRADVIARRLKEEKERVADEARRQARLDANEAGLKAHPTLSPAEQKKADDKAWLEYRKDRIAAIDAQIEARRQGEAVLAPNS